MCKQKQDGNENRPERLRFLIEKNGHSQSAILGNFGLQFGLYLLLFSFKKEEDEREREVLCCLSVL